MKNKFSQFAEKLDKDRIEVIVAILLGFTALLVACVTFLGSSYEGKQATNYAESNNYAAHANSSYNIAIQQIMRDVMDWNNIMDYRSDIKVAEAHGDEEEAELIKEKLQIYMDSSITPTLREAIEWADAQEGNVSPLDMDGYGEDYLVDFEEEFFASMKYMSNGTKDLKYADKYSIVSIVLSLVLFLLGIVGILKNMRNRRLVLLTASCLLVAGIVYMCTIPLPF